MASDDFAQRSTIPGIPAAEQLGDGFSPPSHEQQPTLGEPDALAAAAEAGAAFDSHSAF